MSRTRAKKSFTLSVDALKADRERQNLAALDANVAAYYDSCTQEELIEQQEWGEFASSQRIRTHETDGR